MWSINTGHEKDIHIYFVPCCKNGDQDVARVRKLPLLMRPPAKLVPDKPGTTLLQAYEEVPDLAKERDSSNKLISQTLKYAEVLEGSVRQTGVHACGVIISRDPLDNYIPLCTAKDTELYVTQYDGNHVQAVGLLKMDFLGLKTLSIIKDALQNIRKSLNITVDIDSLPLNDNKTFELFSNGETTAIFQFESTGMKRYLKELKPNRFEDLIAMNALYRPGPMEYIRDSKEKIIPGKKVEYTLPYWKNP
jgi:DNA polymerase-3 subunit alpha